MPMAHALQALERGPAANTFAQGYSKARRRLVRPASR